MLCITGSEAMFADMGHFSHKSILVSPQPSPAPRISAELVHMPACMTMLSHLPVLFAHSQLSIDLVGWTESLHWCELGLGKYAVGLCLAEVPC